FVIWMICSLASASVRIGVSLCGVVRWPGGGVPAHALAHPRSAALPPTALREIAGTPPPGHRLDPATEDPARTTRGRFAVLDNRSTVDEDGDDALGALEEAAFAAGEVVDHLGRAHADAGGIEKDDVGGGAGGEATAVAEAVAGCGDGGEEPDGVGQRQRT